MEKINKLKVQILSQMIVVSLVVGFFALSALILMLAWNGVLVPMIGFNVISYWLSVKGMLSIVGAAAIFIGIRQFVDFCILRFSFYLAKKRVRKEVEAQAELLKHFKMFGDAK